MTLVAAVAPCRRAPSRSASAAPTDGADGDARGRRHTPTPEPTRTPRPTRDAVADTRADAGAHPGADAVGQHRAAAPSASPSASPTAEPTPTPEPDTGIIRGTLTYNEDHELTAEARSVVLLVEGSTGPTSGTTIASHVDDGPAASPSPSSSPTRSARSSRTRPTGCARASSTATSPGSPRSASRSTCRRPTDRERRAAAQVPPRPAQGRGHRDDHGRRPRPGDGPRGLRHRADHPGRHRRDHRLPADLADRRGPRAVLGPVRPGGRRRRTRTTSSRGSIWDGTTLWNTDSARRSSPRRTRATTWCYGHRGPDARRRPRTPAARGHRAAARGRRRASRGCGSCWPSSRGRGRRRPVVRPVAAATHGPRDGATWAS